MRTCNTCNLSKEISQFYKKQTQCLDCKRAYTREWKKKNRDKVLAYYREYNKEYYQENKEDIIVQVKEYYEANKVEISKKNTKYKKENRAKRNSFDRQRRKTDINFKLRTNLRSRLWQALKAKRKSGSAVEALGCSVDELKQHLESKFQEGMSWDNYGNKEGQWSIDHIVPLIRFDLADREQFLKACHYTNLQPMWHFENCAKRDKVVGEVA